MFKKLGSFFESHLFPIFIFIFLVSLHFYRGEEINTAKLIETCIAVLLAELIQKFSSLMDLKEPLKQIESLLLPKVRDNLDYRSSEINNTVLNKSSEISGKIDHQVNQLAKTIDHEVDQLKEILNMFIHDRDLADILSKEIVRNIQITLNNPVDCVFEAEKGCIPTFSKHKIARAALVQMLCGFRDQIRESHNWGLSVESLTPDPEKRDKDTLPKYCEFVIEQTEKADVFLGVSLMPPAWWTDTSLGLPQILDAQKRRIEGLRTERKFKEGMFARIFVIRETLLDSFSKYPYRKLSQNDRAEHVRKELETENGDDKKFLEFYTTANSPEEISQLPVQILLHDSYVKQVVEKHKEAGVLVGFHLVSEEEYKNATDFVLLVDWEGYECVISSLGFEHTVKQNESHDWKELQENLLKRYRGFLEGRLFYSPMGKVISRFPKTEIGKRAKCWFDHAENLTWPKDSADKFLYYYKNLRGQNWDNLKDGVE